jgi:hypothetical protein
VAQAQPIAAQEGLGDRLTYRAGDVLTADLGQAAWDVVFLGNWCTTSTTARTGRSSPASPAP